jgi:hypothetical protein
MRTWTRQILQRTKQRNHVQSEVASARHGLPPCWGIGLPRTGTKSLAQALKVLGYENVRHNPQFEELATIRAGSDHGVTIFYKYLDGRYPGSKFVLTTRDLDEWLASMQWVLDYVQLDKITGPIREVTIMARMMLLETLEFDREKAIAAYHRHHADVKRYFADRPDDLLELRISEGEGWEKLCPFLGVEIPAAEFPSANQRVVGAVLGQAEAEQAPRADEQLGRRPAEAP